jgi:hypothetical protein
MGILFVVLFCLILGTIAAILASIGFGFLTRKFLKGSPEKLRRRAIIAAVALPPVAVISALLGFLGYGVWCETVRGVDAGIGDSWRVPLGSGYSLQMIDVPERAGIETPMGNQVGFGMKRLGYNDRFIYIEAAPDQYLLIDKKTGNSTADLTIQALDMKLKESGASPVTLRSPGEVYAGLRWGIQDIVAGLLILALPVLLALMVLLYVIKVRRAVDPLP